jgi:uncharacterized protein YpuA (DUF1002 family)
MKAQKTFKIGEYAIGGIIVAEINNDKVTIISKQWDTSAGYTKKSSQKNAKELTRISVQVDDSNSYSRIDNYLNYLSTSYYSSKVIEWIETKVKLKY